jgi:hypothetical protein
VHQPSVGEARKSLKCIVIGEADWLAAEVARRHDQRGGARLITVESEQQRVQRGVGQHHAQVGIVRCDRIGDRGTRQAWHQHDRPLRSGQHSHRRLVDVDDGACGPQV